MNYVDFPAFTCVDINMMPIIFGHDDSVPKNLQEYLPIIRKCAFNNGDTVYLTITEKHLNKGEFSRRPGIHTDGTRNMGWGGPWGGNTEPGSQP